MNEYSFSIKDELILGNGQLRLNPMEYSVMYNNREISLSPREFELLYALAKHPGWIYSKEMLYEILWGVNGNVPTHTLENFVYKIRKKMGVDIIETVYTVGYRLTIK